MKDKVVDALLAVLCGVIGHRWSDPLRTPETQAAIDRRAPLRVSASGFIIEDPIDWRYWTACRTCGTTREGDWDLMEQLGAWRHYRSSW